MGHRTTKALNVRTLKRKDPLRDASKRALRNLGTDLRARHGMLRPKSFLRHISTLHGRTRQSNTKRNIFKKEKKEKKKGMSTSEKKEKKENRWCVHAGKTTLAKDCPYTINTGLTCSMAHKDQPDDNFRQNKIMK